MTELSDEQLDIVLARIRKEGINRHDLEADLLDHLSCLIEQQMNARVSFEDACEKVFQDFSPAGGLKRIQFEINYISTKIFMSMKKTLIIVSSLVMMCFFVTTFLQGIRLINNQEWPIMVELAFVNQYLICLVILPLYWLHQFKLASTSVDGLNTTSRSVMFIAGFCCSEALVNAVFFKLLHMPGGNQLFIIASIFGMVYIPFYALRKYRMVI